MSYGRNRYKPDRTIQHALRHHCLTYREHGLAGALRPSATPYTAWDASAEATVTPRSPDSGDRLSMLTTVDGPVDYRSAKLPRLIPDRGANHMPNVHRIKVDGPSGRETAVIWNVEAPVGVPNGTNQRMDAMLVQFLLFDAGFCSLT